VLGKMDSGIILGIGLLGGLGIGVSAWFQGTTGAVAADAFAETGKGFGTYLMVLGLTETVAIFVMVFSLSGPFGLLIMCVSTLIGLVPALSGVSRTHCMGCLLLPTLAFFLGL
jgi:F0F1-type ATP synthase membrane subunit c/vacuolar-type H+-ATPase subunit K